MNGKMNNSRNIIVISGIHGFLRMVLLRHMLNLGRYYEELYVRFLSFNILMCKETVFLKMLILAKCAVIYTGQLNNFNLVFIKGRKQL